MESDEAKFDELIAWLDMQTRSHRKARETIKPEPKRLEQSAEIIPFPVHRIRT
jgi:hypothetical protein